MGHVLWGLAVVALLLQHCRGGLSPKIVGGQDVVPGQAPDVTWSLALNIGGTSLCGGLRSLPWWFLVFFVLFFLLFPGRSRIERASGGHPSFSKTSFAGSIIAPDMILTAAHCVGVLFPPVLPTHLVSLDVSSS